MNVLDYISQERALGHPLLAVLIDPEKVACVEALLPYIDLPDIVLIGGSTGSCSPEFIGKIRSHTTRPLVLFPGRIEQVARGADALLFLSMLSSRCPEVLITPHIQAACAIRKSGLECIATGYILVDGGKKSSVEIATHSDPIPQSEVATIVSTAVAGQLLGKQLIYLEAGSGASTPVSGEIIRAVRSQVDVGLLVGGGICSIEAMAVAFSAGADIVVIGNHFESHPEQVPLFMSYKNAYVQRQHR